MSSAKNHHVPLWDVLPLNSYLVSLLPVEDFLRHMPGLSKTHKAEGAEVLRAVACAWLLWHQYRQPGNAAAMSSLTAPHHNQPKTEKLRWYLYGLLLMEVTPRIYKLFPEEWRLETVWGYPTNYLSLSTPLLELSDNSDASIEIRARTRQRSVLKLFQGSWSLIKLALWLQLTRTRTDSDSSRLSSDQNANQGFQPENPLPIASLFVLYAHRRWLHEQAMELRPTLIEPLRESLKDTTKFLKEIFKTCSNAT